MEITEQKTYSDYIYGYNCPHCGQWVPDGTYHCCCNYNSPIYWDRQQEIINLLYQILDELRNK